MIRRFCCSGLILAGFAAVGMADENPIPRLNPVVRPPVVIASVTPASIASTLKTALDNNQRLLVRDALENGRRIGAEAAVVKVLVSSLDDPRSTVRWQAVRGLATLGLAAQSAIPALSQRLEDTDDLVRWSAADAIARISMRPADAVAVFNPRLSDQDDRVRREAAVALGELGRSAKPAVDSLASALSDRDSRVRQQAAVALGKVGPDASAAVPALRRALQDSDAYVRAAAARSLLAIRPAQNSVAVFSSGVQSATPAAKP